MLTAKEVEEIEITQNAVRKSEENAGKMTDLLNQELEGLQRAKQREEMAKLIDDRFLEARNTLGSMNRGEGHWVAQKLIEYYQPRLPEDSVVLTKDEYERLKSQSETILKEIYDELWSEPTEYILHNVDVKLRELAKRFNVEVEDA